MKKLYKLDEGKMLCGVCTGLADVLHVDVNLVRIAAVVAGACSGIGVVAYIAAALLLPFKPEEKEEE